MFNVLFYFLTSSYILAANLNSLWQAVMSNSYEYQSTEVNLENAEIDNLKAYSAALPNASITPSENKIEMSLNFSPATFSALQAANHTLREKNTTLKTISLSFCTTPFIDISHWLAWPSNASL